MPTFTLIVPHIPKTAGTSLRLALVEAFGSGLMADYGDRPLQHGPWLRRLRAGLAAVHSLQRRGPDCIYGHFLPLKYVGLRHARFALWVRDPVQRVVSRYHHYLRASAAGDVMHRRWGLLPGLSLGEFIELPHYRNTYSEYLWGFPLRRFEFVGAVERFSEDLPRFAERFGIALPPRLASENRNPDRVEPAYDLDPRTQARIRELNAADLRLLDRLQRLPRR
ncbi:MAG TPA: hypothetical protein VFY12_11200 [Arenimonas sp.]|nr:hypothetical protein [Arenimonas sp.]